MTDGELLSEREKQQEGKKKINKREKKSVRGKNTRKGALQYIILFRTSTGCGKIQLHTHFFPSLNIHSKLFVSALVSTYTK